MAPTAHGSPCSQRFCFCTAHSNRAVRSHQPLKLSSLCFSIGLFQVLYMAAHCSSVLKKKKRKRREFFFFSPNKKNKAWEREERLTQRCQLGVWPASPPVPEYQAFTLGHQWGLRDCPS